MPTSLDASSLNTSLMRLRRLLEASIVLTPVDNIPIHLRDRSATAFLHGFYATDRQRSEEEQRHARILFAGRKRMTSDIRSIQREFAERLGGHSASLRLLSGLHAHTLVFMSLAHIGDTVLLLPESAGGHFATGSILSRLGLRVVEAVADTRRMMIDRERTAAIVRREAPSFVFVDRSEGLKYEDFSFLGSITGPIKIFDSSHYLPQILYGDYTNPFDWGFDLQLFTLHKSFPGPQKAGIVARTEGSVSDRCFAGLQTFISSTHVENIYLAGFALAHTALLQTYTERLVSTAVALESALAELSLPVVPRNEVGMLEWPATQHVWLRFQDRDCAFDAWTRLAQARILTNYRLLPYDLGWGIRLGVTAAVIQGLTPASTPQLAKLIQAALSSRPPIGIRHRVRSFAATLSRTAIHAWTFE